jgi:hypothetical protein
MRMPISRALRHRVRNDGEDSRRRKRYRNQREHYQKQQHETAVGYVLAD